MVHRILKSDLYITKICPYTAIFLGCKNVKFQRKNFDIFLIFAQNIVSIEAVLTSTHNLCFRAKIRKKMNTPVNPSFTI